jgi:PPOX class probable F420-dependent enzyme
MGWSASVAELPSWARSLIESTRVAHLGLTDDGGRPRVLPVTFAVAASNLVTAIDHKRKQVPPDRLARIRWLQGNPQAALTIDHYEEDWSRLAWVQALGTIQILEANNAPEAIEALTQRYEQYQSTPPTGPILQLTPERLIWWHE